MHDTILAKIDELREQHKALFAQLAVTDLWRSLVELEAKISTLEELIAPASETEKL